MFLELVRTRPDVVSYLTPLAAYMDSNGVFGGIDYSLCNIPQVYTDLLTMCTSGENVLLFRCTRDFFCKNLKMAAIFENFLEKWSYVFVRYLGIKNLDKIGLSHTVKEIASSLRLGILSKNQNGSHF